MGQIMLSPITFQYLTVKKDVSGHFNYDEFLNPYGNEGWELTHVDNTGLKTIFIFKRAVQNIG